jgi:FkbM family methyltransferase
MKILAKTLINGPLGKFGLEIKRLENAPPRTSSMPAWKERLLHAKRLGLSPNVVVDGGAFKGLWARDIAAIFPGSQIVSIEANPFLQDIIRDNTSDIHPPVTMLNLALGDHREERPLHIWRDITSDTGASLLEHVSGEPGTAVEVQVDTLDNICETLDLKPDLVKLDLQGAELLALKGATKILESAEMIITEFGCLEAYIGRATPRQLIDIMYDNDYCLYDIVDCHYRPYDGALTGGDFIFVKNWSVLRKYKGWQ